MWLSGRMLVLNSKPGNTIEKRIMIEIIYRAFSGIMKILFVNSHKVIVLHKKTMTITTITIILRVIICCKVAVSSFY